MQKPLLSLALAFPLLLAGCGKPVPPEKASYVGVWEHPTMYLMLTQDGSVNYKRIKGGATTSIDGPLQRFDGNDFETGVGPFSARFVVSKPPFQAEAGRWKMVVDGVELTRTHDLR